MEVRRLVAHHLQLDLPVPEAVVAQSLHAALQRLARRLVVVEEVAREQDHVDLRCVATRCLGACLLPCTAGAASRHRYARAPPVREGQGPAEEASAHLALVGNLEDLIERDERVLAADGVLFEVAEVQVRGHQDVNHGVLLRRSILGGLGTE
jgi:hypothetical protein